MKYLYLKLGNGNCQVDYWFNQAEDRKKRKVENVFNRPAVVIFFGKITSERCRDLMKLSEKEYKRVKPSSSEDIPKWTTFRDQIKPFFKAEESDKKGVIDHRFVTIKNGLVYICEPDSEVADMPTTKYHEYDRYLLTLKIKEKTEDVHIPKVMFVKNVKSCKEVPDVLATLSCNNYLNRGTCREINPKKNWGAIQAIKCCLGEPLEKPKSEEQHLSLLGWHQLETLVFLILKNGGVHPSAWRGGTLPQIDIVARNYNTDRAVIIGTTEKAVFEPMEKRTFQINWRMV